MSIMKYLHNPFNYSTCSSCGKHYDSLKQNCPKCNEENSKLNPRYRSFQKLLPLGPIREIGLFLIGFVVLSVLAQIIGQIALNVTYANYVAAGLMGEELTNAMKEYVQSTSLSLLMNDLTYSIVFAGMLLYLWKDNLRLWKSFATIKIFYGLAIGIGIIILSAIWGVIATALGATTNENQSAVNSMTKAAPFVAILVTGLIGPFVEELTYRVGAFTFLKRINTVLAYVVIGALFGLIHIKNWGSLNEWLSYPSYLIAGLALCFAYDKFGFGVAFTAHAFNNLVGVILTLASSSAAGQIGSSSSFNVF